MSTLRQVTIQNFKSIQNQTLDLGRLNVFVGTNGSGKSNLLEALGMLSLAMSGTIDFQGMKHRGMRLSNPYVFISGFRDGEDVGGDDEEDINYFYMTCRWDQVDYVAKIHAKGQSSEEDAWEFNHEFLERRNPYSPLAVRDNLDGSILNVSDSTSIQLKASQGIIPFAATMAGLSPQMDECITALKRYAIYSPTTPILRGLSPDPSMRRPLGLYGGNIATCGWASEVALPFLQLMEWVEGFGYSKKAHDSQSIDLIFRDRFMPAEKFLYTSDVSEGALYILFTLTLLLHQETPPILALDNVDSALNPGMVRNLIFKMGEIIQNHPERQVFLTSHNPATLDGLDLFNPEQRLFIVKRDKTTGATLFDRVQPPEGMTREEWADQHGAMRLSEIWLSGALGGITPPEGF